MLNEIEGKRYNTNLISEYYVLSCLYRVGIEGYLTLANKKKVDIFAHTNKGKKFEIEVKGVIESNWKTGLKDLSLENLADFYIFVRLSEFKNDNVLELPIVYIIPKEDIKEKELLTDYNDKNHGYNLNYNKEKAEGVLKEYLNNWDILLKYVREN